MHKYAFHGDCGFGLTWLSKWIICDVILGTSIVKNAIHQILYRSAGTPRNEINYVLVLLQHISFILVVSIISILVYDFVLSRKKENKNKSKNKDKMQFVSLDNKPILTFICLIPMLWFFVIFNHSYNHIIFTYRNFMTIIILFLLRFFDKEKI